MKFLYEYRTKDNAVHNGVVRASTRDAAYAALRGKGIRPSRLVDAPGLVNKLFGRGKRWLAIAALAAALAAVCIVMMGADRRMHDAQATLSAFDKPTRRQIIGDVAVIDKGIATGWSDVFSSEGDRFLASFAIPGYPPAIRTTTEAEIRKCLDAEGVQAANSLEERQLRAIVIGMKAELRQFLADGGTIIEYGQRLVARQEQEIGYYNRAKAELESLKSSGASEQVLAELWEKRNASLRAMGIRLLSFPERGESR